MEAISRQSGFLRCVAGLTAIVIFLAIPQALTAQETGTVQGTVTQADDGGPLRGVIVSVRGTGISAVTDRDGRYTLNRVPAGPRTIVVRWLGYRTREVAVTVTAGQTATADAALEPQPVTLSEVIVEGVSRAPERVVEAPAAVSVVDPAVARDFAVTGQAPLAVAKLPGSDVVQSGVNDFNVNVRGFNSSLNRRVLVLMDGRDLAIAFLGSQEWPALSASLDDLGRIEMVRGPGSALYGANAFSGVLNITTPTARELVGTKLTLAGGELSTFKGDLRHGGVTPDGRFGYKFNVGYYRSQTWTKSRTARTPPTPSRRPSSKPHRWRARVSIR
jgi:outer membrane receptor protein involved in Fe transport